MELLALVELAVKLVVEESVNEVLVMLLACRARPKSTEGPHSSTAQNYHKQIWKFLSSSSIDSALDAENTYYHIENISLLGQDGPRPQTSKTSLQRSSTVLVDRGGSRNATRLTLRTSHHPWRSRSTMSKTHLMQHFI